jgi:hypothetical protein
VRRCGERDADAGRLDAADKHADLRVCLESVDRGITHREVHPAVEGDDAELAERRGDLVDDVMMVSSVDVIVA